MLKRYHAADADASFTVLPAIDLRGGRVVRLREGDFERETAYSDEPVTVARAFADGGARWIHLVDLDGARAGEPRQLETARAVIEATAGRCRVEVAGGMRTPTAIQAALDAGAARVIVGTAAVRDPQFARELVALHGASGIAAALDVRGGRVVGEAWRAGAEGDPVTDVLARLAAVGIETFEVTAIERDGALAGPDLALLERLVRQRRGRIIASAGIASIDDLRAVRDLGCSGAIVGRALYEGRLDLAEAVQALEEAGGG